jgi:signal transduction histidine kinase
MAGIAISGGEALLGMINNLLDISKLGGRVTHTRVLRTVAARTGQTRRSGSGLLFSPGQESRTHRSRWASTLPAFPGDEDKLRRVLINLWGTQLSSRRYAV